MGMLAEFLLQNSFLSIATAILGGAVVYVWFVGGDKRLLDTDAAVAAMNFERAQIIDLRSREEYDKGHIPNAKHMEVGTVAGKLSKLGKKNPLLLVCAKGTTSTETARKLQADGIENYYILKGGMMTWYQEGKPTTKK